jgi:glutaminyl-peptide cyclotransferase
MSKRLRFILPVLLPLILLSCTKKQNSEEETTSSNPMNIHYTLINTLPHNTDAWTQGLVIYDNKILESTGQPNRSWIAEVNPSSGEHDKKVTLPGQYFGEGITVLNNKIYQITWEEKTGFVYDARTYKKLKEFTYDTQGWGLTHDGKNLIMSDGSYKLHFLDTTTLKPIRSVTVMDGGTRVKELNELEYIDGYVFANVWNTNWILKIDPATGKVVGRIDLSAIGEQIRVMYPDANVLNGIAYDAKSKSLLITGKLWPKSYLIQLQ